MEKIGNYTVTQKIGDTRGSIVYRCFKDSPETPFIIKVLKSSFPTLSEIARLRYEYELIKKIDITGVVKPHEILDYQNGIALVLEDFNGISLNEIAQKSNFSIKEVLEIGIKLSDILGHLHSKNIIHKDIKPHNILYNENDKIVKITDFGISAEVTRENAEIYHPEVIKGTLVYMSPEQTGRMNRTIDYRTDMYSLGITFYELLTGAVPFQSNDPMEVIHSHIAKKPSPPHTVNLKVPGVVSEIVMKLLSKNSEDRYQNCYGLSADLKKCWKEFDTRGEISDFKLGEHDISIKFTIPEKLFGFENEIETLLESFGNTSKGSRGVILVAGEPGIGKSSLIKEIERPIVEKRGFFLSGKFDQYKNNVPYGGIILAFQAFVKSILSMNKEMTEKWKKNLLNALGNNGAVITNLIPDLELIIGTQPSIQELGPDETRNRLNHIFKNFIMTIAAGEHPLVLFLDDLQWIDSASLDLLSFIVTETDIGYLLVIGAYRDTEIDSQHILTKKLDEIEKAGVFIKTTKISPLNTVQVNQVIANFLRKSEEETMPLADIVQAKTGGNPFFVKQFLKTLYDREALRLNPARGWEWSLDEMKKLHGTDNVVDLMIDKLARLPKNIGEALKIAACIGTKFDLEMLSTVCRKSIDESMTDIAVFLDEGFVYYENDQYHFTHDRIHEAAYSLLQNEEKTRIHYEAGRHILSETKNRDLENKIFHIVKHLNNALTLVIDKDERKQLAELNLMAGKKAKESSAYTMAVEYLSIGVQLLPPDSWATDYTLSFLLHIDLGECEYLNANLTRAEELFDMALHQAKTNEDKADVYFIKIQLYIHEGMHNQGIVLALECLKLFGIKLKAHPGKGTIIIETIKAKIKLQRKSIDDLFNLPDVADKDLLIIQKIILITSTASFLVASSLFPLVSMRLFNLVLKYGNTKYAPTGYTGYAGFIIIAMGDYRRGYEFCQLAWRINERYNDISIKAFNGIPVCFVNAWVNPIKTSIEMFEKMHQYALEGGSLYFAGVAKINNAFLYYYSGENLESLSEIIQSIYMFSIKTKNEDNILFSQTLKLSISAFRGMTASFNDTSPVEFNEHEYVNRIKNSSLIISGIYGWTKLRTFYMLGKYQDACLIAVETEKYLKESFGLVAAPLTDFYYLYSLTLTALFANASAKEKKKYLKTIIKNQRKMKKWSELCKENFHHKYLLVEAEIAKITGKDKEAIMLYKQAVDSARDNGFIHNAGIGCECAARFYLDKGVDELARTYLLEARFFYMRWGASVKVKQLDEAISQLPTVNLTHGNTKSPGTDTGSSTGSSSELDIDLNAVVRATQMISGEIVLKKLLERIMDILVENAGAERGFIILDQDGELFIEAEYDVKTKATSVLQSIPVSGTDKLSAMIVNYVYRSRADIILSDATKEGQFINDPYIQSAASKSILCSAIMNAGKVSGILYMENNLSIDAFVPKRLGLLRMISSQAAVSIDNARLYANLEAKVLERTESLNKAMSELWGEMALAKKIQTALLPTSLTIKEYDIVGYMETADDVGGDYYDVIVVNGCRWLVIGDVSGHGVPAGLIMMMVQTAIHAVLAKNPTSQPSELLELVNQVIKSNIEKLNETKYMTITVISVYDQGKFYFSGSHQDLLVYRKSTGLVDIFESRGAWIGVFDNTKGMLFDDSLTLAAGDCLLLYTDGITEAWLNNDPERNISSMYGVERLIDIFTLCGHKSPEEIKNDILASLNEYVANDDVTMLIIKRI